MNGIFTLIALLFLSLSTQVYSQSALNLKLNWITKKELKNRIDSLENVLQEEREINSEYAQLYSESFMAYQELIHEMDYKICTLNERMDSIEVITEEEGNKSVEDESSISPAVTMNGAVDEQVLEDCGCDLNAKGDYNNVGFGGKIVSTGYKMVNVTEEKVKGSCWDYINRVYNNAGFDGSKRKTVFSGKKGSKYASQSMIQPGDWIYHVNHSFRDVGHSAIFICWKDYDKKIGITLSHVGQNKLRTGKYGAYDLSHVYNIMRPAGE